MQRETLYVFAQILSFRQTTNDIGTNVDMLMISETQNVFVNQTSWVVCELISDQWKMAIKALDMLNYNIG